MEETVMAIQNQVRNHSVMGRTQQVFGRIILSGNYPAGGEILKRSSLSKGTNKFPIRALINGTKQQYIYFYDDVNQKLIVRVPVAAPGAPTELPAGAYPVEVSGDVIEYWFVFPKF